jgi:hypothetical protein
VEHVHQTLGNMLRTHKLEGHEFNDQDPWSQILANFAWALCLTIHSVINATPAQIDFGRDKTCCLMYHLLLIIEKSENANKWPKMPIL